MSDNESSSNDRGGGRLVLYGIGLALILYFGFFGAILLDESVFRTFWFTKTMNRISPEFNQRLSEVLRVVYAPLLWLIAQVSRIR